MAETREIRSKPSRLRQQKISGGIQTVDYVTIVRGDVVDGNIFQPQGLNLQAEIDVYSKIPSERYTTLSLTNPDLVRVDEKTGELYALSGRVINGKFTPSIIATPEEQKFSDSLERLAIESAVESIKTDKNNYVDRSNLNRNVETITPGVGGNAVGGTPPENKPSERGGTATPFSYPQVNKERKEGLLYYPLNIADEQDKIEFSVWKYDEQGRSLTKTTTDILSFGFDPEGKYSGAYNFREPAYKQVDKEPKVFLPISNKIMDSNGVSWDDSSINELQRIMASMSLRAMQGEKVGDMSAEKLFSDLSNSIMKSTQFGNAMRTWMAGKAVGVGGLLTRATGAAINPNLELLFQSPQLRTFQFQFLLISKSKKESEVIKKIIRFFKKNMAVRTDLVSLEKSITPTFLNSPYVFGIRYLKKDKKENKMVDHPSINKIKKCALQNFSVDYTPMGSYMTYNDEEGSMFMYSLSMQFKELTPIYDIDYDDHPIGY